MKKIFDVLSNCVNFSSVAELEKGYLVFNASGVGFFVSGTVIQREGRWNLSIVEKHLLEESQKMVFSDEKTLALYLQELDSKISALKNAISSFSASF